jgi:hypothetical protein
LRRVRIDLGLTALAWVLAYLASPASLSARAQAADRARQVTMFAIAATPHGSKVDPKLAQIEPELRKVLPEHGFKLLDVQSKRRSAGESVVCKLRDGLVATTTLVEPLDANGKVQLRCELTRQRVRQLDTLVTTPPNQLFFCDKELPDGSRLLIGIGAR